MEFFDSHCHFDFEVFAGQRAQLWRRCQAAGIARLLVPGVAPAQWQAMLVMAEAYRGIVCAVGLHPWWIDKVPGDSAALASAAWTHISKRRWHCSKPYSRRRCSWPASGACHWWYTCAAPISR